MKTKKVWVVGIIAFLLLMPALLNGEIAIEEIKEKYSIKIESISSDTKNYSDNAKIIMQNLEQKKFMPSGFKGDDIEEIYRYFSKKIPPKDEFETTEKYIERIQSFDFSKMYAFKKNKDDSISYTFDADQNVLEINMDAMLFIDASLGNKGFGNTDRLFLYIKKENQKKENYIGMNAFGAKIEIVKWSGTLYGIIVPTNILSNGGANLRISMLPAKAKQILQNQSKTGIIILCEPCSVLLLDYNIVDYNELLQSVTFEDSYYSKPTFDNPVEFSYGLKCINVKYVELLIYNIETREIYIYSKE